MTDAKRFTSKSRVVYYNLCGLHLFNRSIGWEQRDKKNDMRLLRAGFYRVLITIAGILCERTRSVPLMPGFLDQASNVFQQATAVAGDVLEGANNVASDVVHQAHIIPGQAVAKASSVANEFIGQAAETAGNVINKVQRVANGVLQTASGASDGVVDNTISALNKARTVTGGFVNNAKEMASSTVDNVNGIVYNVTMLAGGLITDASQVATAAASSTAGFGFKVAEKALGVALGTAADLLTSGARAAAPASAALPHVLTGAGGMAVALGGGFIENVANIWRGGDLLVSLAKGNLRIDLPLLLSNVSAGYAAINFSSWLFETSGSVSLRFPRIRLNVTIEVGIGMDCWIRVTSVKLDDMKKPEIDLATDCTTCQAAANVASPYLIDAILPGLHTTIQDNIGAALEEGLPSAGRIICGALPNSKGTRTTNS